MDFRICLSSGLASSAISSSEMMQRCISFIREVSGSRHEKRSSRESLSASSLSFRPYERTRPTFSKREAILISSFGCRVPPARAVFRAGPGSLMPAK